MMRRTNMFTEVPRRQILLECSGVEIAAALTAVGAVTQAVGAMKSASAKSDALEYNARMADRNALIARQQASFEATRQDKLGRMRIGAIRAGYGASGAGSNEDVLSMSITNAELDKQTILYKGELRAMGYQDEAALDRYGASIAIEEGRYASASALLGGAGRAAGIYANYGRGGPNDKPVAMGQTELGE